MTEPEPDRPIRRDAARNRERLLAAADELVAERGLDLSLNELARRAGLGVGTVYRHFPDRDAVIDALIEQRFGQVVAAFQTALADPDPVAGFIGLVTTMFELQSQDRGMFQVIANITTAQRRQANRDRIRPLAEQLVDRAKATGRLHPDFEVMDLPLLTWIAHAVSDCGGTGRPHLVRRYLDLLLDAIIIDGRPARRLTEPPLSEDDFDRHLAAEAARLR